MANMGSQGILKHIDDPAITVVGTSASTGQTWVAEGDAGTSFVRAVAAGKGLHYAGALTAVNNEMEEFCSNNLMFTGQEGHSAVEILLQLSRVTSIAVNFGFNDEVLETGSNSLPMEIGTTTVSANSASFVGLVFDTGATSANLHCCWVDDSTVGQTDSAGKVDGKFIKMDGMAPIASKWLYMKVEMQDRGSGNGVRATFLAVDSNGRSVEKVFNTSLDRDVPLCYYLGIENRVASTASLYTKGNNWEQTIPNM